MKPAAPVTRMMSGEEVEVMVFMIAGFLLPNWKWGRRIEAWLGVGGKWGG